MKAYIFTSEIWKQVLGYMNRTHHLDNYWDEMDADIAPKVLGIIRNKSVQIEATYALSTIQLKHDTSDAMQIEAHLHISISNRKDYESIAKNINPHKDHYALVQTEERSKDWVLIASPYRRCKVVTTLPTPPVSFSHEPIRLHISAAPVESGVIIREE